MGVNEEGASGLSDKLELWEMEDRMAILLTLSDKPGILNKALNMMSEHNVNMSSIQSRPPKISDNNRVVDFNIDFYGNYEQKNVQACLRELRQLSVSMTEVGTPEVPWFPTKIEDFDHIGKRILGEGDGI